MRASVLVTDGEQRAALAIVRSLGHAGHRVYVCSPRALSLAGASRHARAEAIVPDPLREPQAYVDAVERLVRGWKTEVLLPVTDGSLLALLPTRERFAGVCIPFPPADCFRRISDKATVLRTAGELGIATPRQWIIPNAQACRTLERVELPFPLAVKPARSIAEGEGRRVNVRVRYAADRESLREALDGFRAAAYPLLLQQRVVGPGVGVFLLIWDGLVLASFAHRRIREKPPSGGVSTYRESVRAEPGLVARSRALLDRFGWRGVAMLEYKVEARSGTPYLMEVNGRFWGSLQLAIDAGVDFPKRLVAAALGAPPAPASEYLLGVRSRWWWGDVDHLLARLRRSSSDLDLPPGAGSRWRALLDFAVLWRPGDRSEVLRADDPAPFLRETLQWLRAAFDGAFRLRRSRERRVARSNRADLEGIAQ